MIERLYVHNFRCLENFTLDLAGRPSALVIGKNGAGKSTVLQCLEDVSEYLPRLQPSWGSHLGE